MALSALTTTFLLQQLLLLRLLSVHSEQVVREEGRCVTFGLSRPWSQGEKITSLVNNTRMVPLDSGFDDLPSLASTCPSLAGSENLCCDSQQYAQLVGNLQMAGFLLKRCPACFVNFREFFCQYTCSPNQSLFKEVFTTSFISPGKTSADGLRYYVDSATSEKFFDACKDVELGAQGEKIMKLIFQAENYREFLAYLGKPLSKGGHSPEEIKFPSEVRPGSGIVFLSSENGLPLHRCSSDIASLRCTCADCTASCGESSTNVLDANAASKPSDGRDVFFYLLCVPCVLFVAAVILPITVTLIRSFRPHQGATEPLINADLQDTDAFSESGSETDQTNAHNYHNLSPIAKGFYKLGWFVGSHPFTVVLVCTLTVLAVAAVGIPRLSILKDPIELWAPPESTAYRNKLRHDATFGPFYRIEQLMITSNSGPIFHRDTIQELLMQLYLFQDRLSSLTVVHDNKEVGLEDICFRLSPDMSCEIQSPLGYFRDGVQTYADPYEHLAKCTVSMTSADCLDRYGIPSLPNVVLGGYPMGTGQYMNASTAMLIFLVEGSTDMAKTARAEAWERRFLKLVQDTMEESFWSRYRISYSTEQSLQAELNSQVSGDAAIISLSYVVMFLYVSLALGQVWPLSRFLRGTRMMLGLFGVLVVVLALLFSVGICALSGLRVTLIISEVIPFLVLAIGVDNIFIIQNAFERQEQSLPYKERLARSLADVGVSITLSSLSECFAFLLGTMTNMPAVQSFAIYASVAIFVDFLLQITIFAAAVVLDARRRDDNRVDVFPCMRLSSNDGDNVSASNATAIEEEEGSQAEGYGGVMETFVSQVLVPFLRDPIVKTLVIVVFSALALTCLGLFRTHLELGLDQRVALPRNSYLQEYYMDIADKMRVGPPAYFVVDGGVSTEPTQQQVINADMRDISNQNRVCDLLTCNVDSMGMLMALEGGASNSTYFASGVSNWVGDYLQWMNPPAWSSFGDTSTCCRMYRNGTMCDPASFDTNCLPCISSAGRDVNGVLVTNSKGRPLPVGFDRFLPAFLESKCSDQCSLCATPHLMNMDIVHPKNASESLSVPASKFMAYHTVLQTQNDYISALKSANYVADSLTKIEGMDIYPYSVFYVFFEQYLTIEAVAAKCIGLALVSIFLLCLALLRSLRVSILIAGTITMILVDTIGLMAVCGVNLNAVSVVNLVMSIGICVEFCVHISVAFVRRAKGSRDQRIAQALVTCGSCIIRGIFLTKFLGVAVLFFSQTPLIQVYYFRMYFLICVLAGAHGLVFLPVLLSCFGPECER